MGVHGVLKKKGRHIMRVIKGIPSMSDGLECGHLDQTRRAALNHSEHHSYDCKGTAPQKSSEIGSNIIEVKILHSNERCALS